MDYPEDFLIVFVTTDTADTAEQIASALVSERLCACVNIISSITSIYEWQGEMRKDVEALMIIKTTASVYAQLEAKIRELHPYEVPEIIAICLSEGSERYLNWIADFTMPDHPD